MFRIPTFALIATLLTSCVDSTAPPAQAPAAPAVASKARALDVNLAAYRSVSTRLEPIAEAACLRFHRDRGPAFCDFQIRLINDPSQPPNAFQSVGRDGKPVIAFNINLIKIIENDDEIAFILGHEAGHQIATHLIQARRNITTGAILGAIIAGVSGVEVQAGIDLGSTVGHRAYSQEFELEADTIGTHIAARAGYDPTLGAQTFRKLGGGAPRFFSTHPPAQARLDTVARTHAQIRAAQAQGQTAPIRW